MIRKLGRILLLTGLLILSGSVAEAAETVYERTEEEQVGNGLTYEYKSKLTVDGWVDIHVLIADLEEGSLDLDIIRDEEAFGLRDGISDMAEEAEDHFLGGINGSFFSVNVAQSDIEGFEFEDGQVSFTKDDYNLYSLRSANFFMYEDMSPALDFISTDISLMTEDDVSIYIVGFNTIGDLHNPVIFNRNGFENTEGIDGIADVYKVVVEDDEVVSVAEPKVSVEIPENGYVITLHEDDAEAILKYLDEGTEVTLDIKTNLPIDDLAMAFPGGGMILRDGEVVEEGLIVGKDTRHPRTALGLTEDGRYMVMMVVDGRGESIGATHEELADYLLEYEVDQAMHMDGGGSSTLIASSIGDLAPEVRNNPSDGSERSVVNGLGFVLDAEETEEFNLYLTANQERVFVDNKIVLDVKAADLNYNPLEVDTSQIAWSISGGYGVLYKMEFVPKEAGTITITASYKGESQSIDIEVVDELIDLEIEPKVIHFDDGVQSFTVIGTDAEGHRSIIDNDLLDWEISNDAGSIFQGVFRGGDTPTDARIDVTYQGIKEVAYVATGEIREEAVDLEDVLVETLVYPETVLGMVQKKDDDGEATVVIGYDFAPSEVSQAVYAVFENGQIRRDIDEIVLGLEVFPEEVLLKGHLTDANDEQYTLNFELMEDGDVVAKIPDSVSYPIRISRIYAVTLAAEEAKSGEIVITSIDSVTKVKEKDLDDVINIAPIDDKYELYPEEGYTIKLFGATSGRNRLLDEVVLGKVYDVFNEADYAIYAGSSNIDEEKVTNDHFIYDDAFDTVDLDEVRLISLGMSEGSLVKTDSSQWEKLETALASAVQDTIVIIGTEKLVDNDDESFTKEGELIHEVISSYAGKSDKNVFYINASGYAYNLSYYEGIRYIDLNGLWYKVGEDHAVDLYDSFQTVTLNINGSEATYNVTELYPKTTVSD